MTTAKASAKSCFIRIDLLSTEAVLAAEAVRVQLQLNGDPMPGQIGDAPEVAAVDAPRSPVTARALGQRCSGLYHQRDGAGRRQDTFEADGRGVGQQGGGLHAARYCSAGRQNSLTFRPAVIESCRILVRRRYSFRHGSGP
jgi:hypothetical protein